MAQSTPPKVDGGTLLQQQTTPPVTLPRVSPLVLPPGFAPKPALTALPSVTVSVNKVTFSGNIVFSDAQLAPLTTALIGQIASLADLNAAADKVRQFYRQRGYLLAQAYLPRQDITQGSIEITVLEGSLGRVTVSAKPDARLRQSFAQGMFDARLTPGQPITEAALETPLLLLTDLPGVAVQSSVSSGASVGSADLAVSVGQNANPVTGSVDYDNQGSKFTGVNRVAANLALNNASGYGDQFSARVQVALDNRRSNSARIGWQTPVGYYGTQAGAAFTRLNYSLIGDFAPLLAEGDASTTSLYASHPLVRSRNANLTASLSRDSKRIEDRTLAVVNTETRRIASTRLSVRGDARDALWGGGLSSFNLGLTSGKLNIEQAGALANDQAPTGPQTQGSFGKTNLDLLRLQTITDQVSLLATFKAQWASKNLPSAEKISLGGPNDVRAYPVGEASGDQGYAGTLEARYSQPDWRIGNAQAVVSVFYDFGAITINKTPQPGIANNRSLKGAGFGLTLASGNDYSLRAVAAWRVGNQAPKSDADRAPRIWLQASKSF